ncbi:TetR/AcrR family transcriptional regulator [Dyella sp. 2RAB6]|uniref:TetR/AcrR family transcriptional regulator n=1 Tax=Dyella sp. 2RAB6 TaxID=3232992 RepID=UPI003F922F9C
MPRKRLTRTESREKTRQRLLDAAAISIARKGLASTSVEEIAAQAGYTRGAFYSNFRSKNDLFVELLQLDHQNTQENLRKLLKTHCSGDHLHTQLASLHAQYYPDGDHYILWAEARLHALRDMEFRQCVNVLYLEKLDLIACIVDRLCTCPDMQLPSFHADQALALIALMDGDRYFNMTMPDGFSSILLSAILSIDGPRGPIEARASKHGPDWASTAVELQDTDQSIG